ncbi:MAG: tyrosine protein phosphatase, partial [Alphaproteobacteria bacterium HGW-Alphaproteobacteria-12]
HADSLLKREGRMSAAVEALGPGRACWEGELFSIPLRPAALRSSRG